MSVSQLFSIKATLIILMKTRPIADNLSSEMNSSQNNWANDNQGILQKCLIRNDGPVPSVLGQPFLHDTMEASRNQ